MPLCSRRVDQSSTSLSRTSLRAVARLWAKRQKRLSPRGATALGETPLDGGTAQPSRNTRFAGQLNSMGFCSSSPPAIPTRDGGNRLFHLRGSIKIGPNGGAFTPRQNTEGAGAFRLLESGPEEWAFRPGFLKPGFLFLARARVLPSRKINKGHTVPEQPTVLKGHEFSRAITAAK